MGSPVSVVVANVVMEDIEEKAIRSFRNPPRIWKRYVDDTFVIMDQKEVGSFLSHINNLEESTKFTMEIEDNGKIAFLDALIHRDERGVLTSTVYRKKHTLTDIFILNRTILLRTSVLWLVPCWTEPTSLIRTQKIERKK